MSYANNIHIEMTLEYFESMAHDNKRPNQKTIISIFLTIYFFINFYDYTMYLKILKVLQRERPDCTTDHQSSI